MNNDLISRSALKEQFSDMFNKDYEKWINEIIDNAPTVDTTCPNCDSGYAQGYLDGYLKGREERPTGHWIMTQNGSGRCSNCGELQCCTDNYCPNCGAKMMKEANNE